MDISTDNVKKFINMDEELILADKKQEMLVSTGEPPKSYSLVLSILESPEVPYEGNEEFITNATKSLYSALFNSELMRKRTEAIVRFGKMNAPPKDYDFHIALIQDRYTLWKVVPWIESNEEDKKDFSYFSLAIFSKDKDVMDNFKDNLPKFNKIILGFLNALATSVYDKYTGDVEMVIETGIPEELVKVEK